MPLSSEELKKMEKDLMDEVSTRRKLGGFDVHASGLLLVCETLLKIIQHLQPASHGHSTKPKN